MINQGHFCFLKAQKTFFITLKIFPHEILLQYYKSYCHILIRVVIAVKKLHNSLLIRTFCNTIKAVWSVVVNQLDGDCRLVQLLQFVRDGRSVEDALVVN